MPWLDKHTFPRLARSTVNELQQNQHEKASLVCVRVQSPSGLALVPCALSMVDLSGNYDVELKKHTERCFDFYFWHPMLVRPSMKRLFCLKAKNGLGRFAPSAFPHYSPHCFLHLFDKKNIFPQQLYYFQYNSGLRNMPYGKRRSSRTEPVYGKLNILE